MVRCTPFLETEGKKVDVEKFSVMRLWLNQIVPLAEIGGSRTEVKVWNNNLKNDKQTWSKVKERIVVLA